MKKTWKVTFKVENPGVVVTEYLRYAGVIGVHGGNHNAPDFDVVRNLGELKEDEVFVTMYEPPQVAGEVWMNHQTQRLASFGVKTFARRS